MIKPIDAGEAQVTGRLRPPGLSLLLAEVNALRPPRQRRAREEDTGAKLKRVSGKFRLQPLALHPSQGRLLIGFLYHRLRGDLKNLCMEWHRVDWENAGGAQLYRVANERDVEIAPLASTPHLEREGSFTNGKPLR